VFSDPQPHGDREGNEHYGSGDAQPEEPIFFDVATCPQKTVVNKDVKDQRKEGRKNPQNQ
jgi:hypothetical protein